MAGTLTTVLALHGAVALPSLVARIVHGRPGADGDGIPKFSEVDGSLWRGGRPTSSGYEHLASRGVELIVDLRAESRGEAARTVIDPLGLQVMHVSIRDGQVPSGTQLAQIGAALATATGVVFVYCGAGVGRTGTVIAARQVDAGVSPWHALVEALSFGPLTLEQQAFVAGGARPRRGQVPAVMTATSRLIDSPRRLWARLAA